MMPKRIFKKIRKNYINPVIIRNRQKIFCVGRNKTGTTSLKKALIDLGYIVGVQTDAGRLFPHYDARNFHPIINYCKKAEAFQDIPFSLPYTFIHLDQAFPGSKFILTIRATPQIWYDSLIRFHSKLFRGSLPSAEQLRNADYCYKGFMYETIKVIFGTPDNDLYNKEIMINHYNEHNKMVMDYFKFRPKDLLVLNLKDKDSYLIFCEFVRRKPVYDSFPWENKTT